MQEATMRTRLGKLSGAGALMLLGLTACGSSGTGAPSPSNANPTVSGNPMPAAGTNPTMPAASTGSVAPGNSATPSNSGAAGSTTATPSPSGTAGTQATPAGSAGAASDPMQMQPAAMAYPDPRGACNINSGFPDDHACILPPAAGEGMQIHIGPTDYKDPSQINKFVFHAGAEASECWSFHTPNDQEIYYQTSVLSGRAGTHHIIDTMYKADVTDGGFVMCLSEFNANDVVDTLPGASRAYMERGTVAPENVQVGRKIGAHAPSQADMHYFNFTDADILREFWINIYFVPKEQIKVESKQIRGMGGVGWTSNPIAPGTDMVYQYSCPITANGRIIQLLGHYHAHGKRFTAYLHHAGGARDKVFEMYDYQDPRTFQYDSITMNPAFSDSAPGAYTGQIAVKSGDALDWECHIVNDSMVGLTYTNMVKTGEMCNLWGASVDSLISCFQQ
jgi:hypothetical protein